MHRAAFAQADLSQLIQITDMIDVLKEARLAIIASLHNVLGHPGKIESALARHLAVHKGKSHPVCCVCQLGSVRSSHVRPSESAH